MLIITSKGLPSIEHTTPSGNITFGPVFNFDFLQDVFYLQEKILGMLYIFIIKLRNYGLKN